MKAKMIIGILVCLMMLPIANAAWELKGNFYECTSGCTSLDAGDKGIWLKGSISVTGPAGAPFSGCTGGAGDGGNPGGNGNVTLTSNTVIRVSANVAATGGAGSDGRYCSHNSRYGDLYAVDSGGIGGNGEIIFTAPKIVVDDGVSLTAMGGEGGEGDNSWSVTCSNDGSYYSSTYSGCASYCSDWCDEGCGCGSDDRRPRSKCRGGDGGNGGSSTITLTASESIDFLGNTNFVGVGGNGNVPDRPAAGGDGGNVYVYLDSPIINSVGTLDVNIDTGIGEDSEGDYTATCHGDDNCNSDDSDDNGGDAGTGYFYIQNDAVVNASRINIDILGNDGGDPGGFQYGDPCGGTHAQECGSDDGGDGGSSFISMDLGDNSVIDDLDITTCSGEGGFGSIWGDSGGDGGTNTFYLYGKSTITDGTWNFNSGTDCGDGNYGKTNGGHGGATTAYIYGGANISNVDITAFNGGDGGDAYTGSSYFGYYCKGEWGGEGRSSAIHVYDNATFNNVDVTLLEGGDSGESGRYGGNPYAGEGQFTFSGTNIYINGSIIKAKGGDGRSSYHDSDDGIARPGRVTITAINNGSLEVYDSTIYAEAGSPDSGSDNDQVHSYVTLTGGDLYFHNGTVINSVARGSGQPYIYMYPNRRLVFYDDVTIDSTYNPTYWPGGYSQYMTWSGTRALLGLYNTYIPDETHASAPNDPDCIEVARSGRTDQNIVFDTCSSVGSVNDLAVDLFACINDAAETDNTNVTTNVEMRCYVNIDIRPDASTIYGNFTWYENDMPLYTQNDVVLSDGVNYASINITAGDTNISDVFRCDVDTFGLNYTQDEESFNATIIPTYPFDVQVDIGSDGTIEYNGTGYLIDQTLLLDLNTNSINKYLRDCVPGDPVNRTCDVPIRLISSTNALLNVTNLSIYYGTENATNQDIDLGLYVYSGSSGIIVFDNLNFEYATVDEARIRAYVDEAYEYYGSEDVHYIDVTESLINVTEVPPYRYLEFYPVSLTETGVAPLGGNPFWNFSSEGDASTCKPTDIYVRLNETVPYESTHECIAIMLDTPFAHIRVNSTMQQIFNATQCYDWSQTMNITLDLNCTWGVGVYFEPVFIFSSIAHDAVRTYDWEQ